MSCIIGNPMSPLPEEVLKEEDSTFADMMEELSMEAIPMKEIRRRETVHLTPMEHAWVEAQAKKNETFSATLRRLLFNPKKK